MNICIFASGTGSNFEAILKARNKGLIKSEIALLISNNSKCNAVKIAADNGIKYVHISRLKYPDLNEDEYSDLFLDALQENKIDLIVLAGYMKFIDKKIINRYNKRIINIHPALLPSFGGPGMFGINVHKAVIQSGVKVTGLTIHFVNEDYDKGEIVFQKCVKVSRKEDEFTLQKRILKLEHKYYSKIISKIESGKIKTGI